MSVLDSCRECFRLLCKVKVSSGVDQRNWQNQLTQHQVKDHRNSVVVLFPDQVVTTEQPKVRKP